MTKIKQNLGRYILSGLIFGLWSNTAQAQQYAADVDSFIANDIDRSPAAAARQANKQVREVIAGKNLKADAVSREAFQSLRNNLYPLTPEQIRVLKRDYNTTERAKKYEGNRPPKQVSRVVQVDLNPGASTPVVRLGVNMVSSILFLDSSGQPWPIVGYDLGNPTAFDIQWQSKDSDSDVRSNTLMIQPQQRYGRGNLAIMLQGLNVPVVLTLVPGQSVVDYRADIQIPEHGPNAINLHDGLPIAASSDLVSFLNAVPPAHAKRLIVDGVEDDSIMAWHVGADLYVRTPYELLSPAFISKMNGANGRIKVFKTSIVPSILLLKDGEVVELNVKGF